MTGVFETKYSPLGSVHDMRRTLDGMAYLRETHSVKPYMIHTGIKNARPFFAWDGEGWTDGNMEHSYMLLQTSSGARIHAPRVSTDECLEFMMQIAAQYPKHIHVIYGGGYDAAQILRDIPLALTAQLKDNEPITYYADANGAHRNRYTINYLPHKWLEVKGYDWHTQTWAHIKIFDVMTFFQTSFMKALQSRHIDVPEIISTGKAARGHFTYLDIDEVSTYCGMELDYLVQLCDKLREEMTEAGIWLTQFHGPGAVANVIFKKNRILEYMGDTLPDIETAAQRAYFGGRFEQFKAGHYEGKVYLYDINSAYPNQIRNLPDMTGATWERTTDFHGQLGIWLCTYDDAGNDYLKPHPLPWRAANGEVGFPAHNSGVWCWTPEAVNADTILDGYQLNLASDRKPFEFVTEMYLTRRRWQKEGKGGERALKLALNSLYGKMAQRVGGRPENGCKPKYHKLEWAGLVTSATRAQLWDAIKQHPESVIAVETDSIMTARPLELDIGTGLGQWGETTFDWVTYIQSGIYFTSNGVGKNKAKTRGIDAAALNYPEVLQWLQDDCREPLLVASRMFIGLGNPRTNLYAQWQDSTKEVKIAGQKRLHSPRYCEACTAGLSLATHPHDLIAAPHYGYPQSTAHTLPWRDGATEDQSEDTVQYVGDAIQEYDVPRRQ